ncbi:hypothetical protein [Acidovorax sp. A1169]|uniref:LPD3 domain-containing protein n=1 Tax=Acidovorax sp. A1169 TaxID=3059524 RepID=UPI00273800A0|nr:hypothetical protein [Acidovorax sp. A1169]MDP4076863.1 hypothetical protein [Acidovorax sp. A1169]
MLPGSGATWSEVAAADRKAQAEAEILRHAEALPAQDAPTDADAGQAAPSTAASTSADADPSAAQAEEQGAARHTAAAQVPMQVQALDSGMLVVRGDQAAIQSRLQAGGVGGARSFSGVTVVPVEQAALARRVLSAPPVESAHRQVGGVPARALTAANAAQEAASLQGAQQAPAVLRGEPAASGTFAGARTAGTSAAGLAAPLAVQGQQAGAQASAADVRALPQAPVQMEPLRDGTLMVRGDAKLICARLLAGGVDRVIERKGGIVVGLDEVDKARKVLLAAARPQSSPSPSRQGQQFSRSAPPAPDQASQARGLPSQPATVHSVRAAVARLTNSMGLLAGGRGRVVATTSDEIKEHWEPLIGEVDMGSQNTGLAHGFYDPETQTVFLIADHIEAGQEMAVAAHELMHKHGKAVLGERGWRQLHEVIGTWVGKPDGSLERQVYDEAVRRVDASRPAGADAASYSSEELFPYAVQVAMDLGVEPTAMRPITTVQGWLARVRASLQALLGKLTGNPQAFDGQDLVDLAFGIAQRERSTRDDTSGAATDLVHGTAQRTALLFSRTRVPKVREASTFSEAREAVKQFQGKELTNESTGLKAVVSRNSLDKMLSGKAVAKSETPATHSMAVANADSLFEHAILGWSKQDRSDDLNIRAVHRFFAHMQVNGRSKLVKLTVKEDAARGHGLCWKGWRHRGHDGCSLRGPGQQDTGTQGLQEPGRAPGHQRTAAGWCARRFGWCR